MLKPNKLARTIARKAKEQRAALFTQPSRFGICVATPDAIQSALAYDRAIRVCHWQEPIYNKEFAR